MVNGRTFALGAIGGAGGSVQLALAGRAVASTGSATEEASQSGIPDRYRNSVRWRRRRVGRIEAAHPVFLKLGAHQLSSIQALDQAAARGAEVARAARLSASATSAALRVLAEHGLAVRGPGGWRRGPVALADLAESTGAADLQREREAPRYRQDREGWRARLDIQGARQMPAVVGP